MNPGDDIKRLTIWGAWVKILRIQGASSEISLRGYRTSSCQGFESRGRVLSACAASPHKFDSWYQFSFFLFVYTSLLLAVHRPSNLYLSYHLEVHIVLLDLILDNNLSFVWQRQRQRKSWHRVVRSAGCLMEKGVLSLSYLHIFRFKESYSFSESLDLPP